MANNGIQVGVKITGVREIREQLEQLSPRLGKRLVRASLRKAGEFLKAQMRGRAPMLAEPSNKDAIPGELRDSIDFVVSTGRGGATGAGTGANPLDRIALKVGPTMTAVKKQKTMNPGIYATFVEFGLKRKNYASVPFVRPTFDNDSQGAIDIVANDLAQALPGMVQRHGTGGYDD